MNFGSVQFYKRLIVIGYLLLILVPLIACVILGVLYAKEKNRADALQEATLAELTQILQSAEFSEYEQPLQQLEDLLSLEQDPISFPYQALYPHLYSEKPLVYTAEENVCYLTFDDGPGALTPDLLALLSELDVQATFFVTGEYSRQHPNLLRDIADDGHSIGVHTYSHEYDIIYSSVEAYLSDFDQLYRLILDSTGSPPEIFRFPGGSVNAYNQTIYTPLIAEMSRRGFVYFDWNVSAQDAVVGNMSSDTLANNVLQGVSNQSRLVVLMHDHADNTALLSALPTIVQELREQGFRFDTLDNTVEPIVFFPDSSV